MILALKRLLPANASAEKLAQREAELATLREGKAESDRLRAVAEERASRVPGLEAALREANVLSERLREDQATAEREYRTDRDSLLAKSEEALSELRSAKGKADEALAARNEAVGRLEGQLHRIGQEHAATLTALEAARAELPAVRSQLAVMHETMAQERKQNDEKLALLNDAKTRLTEQFKVLAEEVMGRHGETFKQQNKEQLDGLLTPLREQLTGFQQKLQADHLDTAKDRERLVEQIRVLATTGATMTSETRSLTLALRGESQTQGAWGEMILSTILQRSGLREGEEYVTQESHTTEDGARLRTDVVIKLPGEKEIVIDSKVSLSAFTRYVNETEPAQKAEELQRHVASMRGHIKGLSRKQYHQLTGLDFVIMFVPIEGALAAALQEEPELTSFAAEQNVVVATPTTLMLALRTVANVWHVERRNKNAEEIAERAGKLYDKFVGFVGDMQALGSQLEKSQRTYDDALSKLSTGAGNLVRQTELLKSLGAKTAKTLPLELVADAHAGASDGATPALPTK